MERVLIVYFTGTGNTWMAADVIASELENHGYSVDLQALEKTPNMLDISPYSMIGIGFPVYAWCFPSNVRRFLKRLPLGQGRGAFVFSTMQDASVAAEALAARYLKRKDYRVTGARAFTAPNNETIYFGPDDPTDPNSKKILERMRLQARSFAAEILSGRGEIENDRTSWIAFSELCGVIFDLLDGWPASRNFRVLETCTRCGICERICPENNIFASLTWPRFRNRCLMCERCVDYCPAKAIVHPLHRAPYSDIRYHAPGYRPPLLREPTAGEVPSAETIPDLSRDAIET